MSLKEIICTVVLILETLLQYDNLQRVIHCKWLKFYKKAQTIGPLFPITLTLLAPKCVSKSSFSLLFNSDGRCRTYSVQFGS